MNVGAACVAAMPMPILLLVIYGGKKLSCSKARQYKPEQRSEILQDSEQLDDVIDDTVAGPEIANRKPVRSKTVPRQAGTRPGGPRRFPINRRVTHHEDIRDRDSGTHREINQTGRIGFTRERSVSAIYPVVPEETGELKADEDLS